MTRKLRVLHLGNGSAYKIKAIIDGLISRGHEIHMVPIPPVTQAFEGVIWHHLPRSPLPAQAKVLHRMLQVRRLARRLRPDIVHAHNAWGPGWYGAVAGSHPFVIHGYGGDLLPEQYGGRPALQRRLTSWACRTADQIIVTGQHMVGASRHLGIDPDRVTLLPRGVDLKRYRPGLDVSNLRRKLGLGNAGPIIFSPRYQVDESLYNLDVVLTAFARVRLRFPDAVCLQMCSRDGHRGIEALRALATQHGLADSYRLVPSVDNALMPLYFNIADAAVSVPSSDGFPVTVLEAAACACPLIVSDLPYCKDWFISRENGLVIPARDSSALAEAIGELCLNRGLREEIGSAGRRQVTARADYEHCMDKLEALYFRLLERQSRNRQEVI
jgi:glycosyltransferase involved in cell wall biosynthesis